MAATGGLVPPAATVGSSPEKRGPKRAPLAASLLRQRSGSGGGGLARVAQHATRVATLRRGARRLRRCWNCRRRCFGCLGVMGGGEAAVPLALAAVGLPGHGRRTEEWIG